MKKLLLLATLSTMSFSATAGELGNCEPFALVGNISHHFGNNDKYRNEHPSAGGGCEFDGGEFVYSTQGIYTKNSYDRDSLFVTGNANYIAYEDKTIRASIGLTGGFATGYEPIKASKGGFIPILGANAEICRTSVCLYALALPNYSDADGVVTGGFKYKF